MKPRTSGTRFGPAEVWFYLLLLAALVLATSPAAAAPGEPQAPDTTGLSWLTETVDTAERYANMSSRSASLDSNGNAGIAFGSQKLYLARQSGSNWTVSIVDASFGVGAYASLDFDGSNAPHISYYDSVNGQLKYAVFRNNAWTIETVTAAGNAGANVGLYTSIAVDSNNRPRISYYDSTFQELAYIYKDSNNNWIKNVVNSVGPVGKHTSLALDRNGGPHISYWNEGDNALMYARISNNQWVNVFVDAGTPGDPWEFGGVGLYSSIAVDVQNTVHISYYNGLTGNLLYAKGSGSTFSSDIVLHITGKRLGLFSSIALDNNRNPRISAFVETDDDLIYTELTDDGWETTWVETDGRVGLYTSLAVNPVNNRPTISYYDFGNNSLKVAVRGGSDWTLRTLATAGSTGAYNSLALDAGDNPHIAYYDESSTALRYARWTGSAWQRWELDSQGIAGLYATLALDSNDYAHIAYYDGAVNELRYIRWTGTAWSGIQVVDTNGDVGKYASIAVDLSNNPHISYLDSTNRVLKYAYWNGTTWVTQVVDNSGDVGYFTSLKFDASGAPHIAYFDESNDRLKYAYYASGGWQYEIIDGLGSMGTYASLVIDHAGVSHVSYYDFTPGLSAGRLKYAVRTGTTWNAVVVDGEPDPPLAANAPNEPDIPDIVDAVSITGGVGLFTSIAVDSANQPYISYYDDENDDLKYAFISPSGWQSRPVYTLGNVGLFTSIAVGSDELPRISFQDATERQLNYTRSAVLDFQYFMPFTSK